MIFFLSVPTHLSINV